MAASARCLRPRRQRRPEPQLEPADSLIRIRRQRRRHGEAQHARHATGTSQCRRRAEQKRTNRVAIKRRRIDAVEKIERAAVGGEILARRVERLPQRHRVEGLDEGRYAGHGGARHPQK
ncbi:MAG: hypothetical protein ACK56I_17580, partial [bacterium]